MILQKLLFPSTDICANTKMYYNGENVTVIANEESCNIPNEQTLSANTYFNSFSIEKWTKYTILDNLTLNVTLKGKFAVSIHQTYKMHNKIKDTIVAEQLINSARKAHCKIDIPLKEKKGLFYFTLKALSDDAIYFGGAYESAVKEKALPDVKLAIGICTFKREAYVANNMRVLNEAILENSSSPLYNKLEIFISDNSKTLGTDLESDYIHIFPNRNLGGSGGFTRAMIEAKKASETKNFTHILMMDDDIRLNPDSIVRTYTMLRLLKPEHKDAFIGGHMLKIDDPAVQSEAADHWDIVAHHPVKFNYNLENINFLIKNEIEDTVNHFGWWYCCMPMGVISDNNLPLPIFIKRDDIEYGLRNGKTFITLNGVCVWHEPFEYKSASYLEYYYFRNMCIMNSRHRLSFSADRLISEVKNRVLKFVLCYRYKDAELSLLGVQHYLKGIDWLKSQDAEKLNSEIMKLGYKKEPLQDLDFVFIHGNYEPTLVAPQLNRKQKIIRKLTLNGWLLPTNKTVVVPAHQPSIHHFYRAGKVLNYEEATNSGFITTRDKAAMRRIHKLYRKTVKMIKKNYKRVTTEYRNRYDELIDIKFWNDYLFNSGEIDAITSVLENNSRPKSTKAQKKELRMARLLKLVQALLFWLPVKKNRVMAYIHDRKGFTCNPKYIVKKLVEKYGDDLEIIWATMHPDTCQEIEELGIRVVKSNTLEQFKLYLRTKFFITNDAFPSWAMHRPMQKWLNTWHAGMNYKHIGYDYLAPQSRVAAKLFRIKNKQPNFYLSGSGFFTEDTSKSFRLNKKIFLKTGLPRNDVFFEDPKAITKKVREFYGITKDKHLAIFAPTFRRGMKSDTYGMDFDRIRKALKARFGGNWVILFRNHNFVKSKQKYAGALDVSGYHDMQELMVAADVLISDYSSCLYDFCMTRKPAFVYATDLDSYRNSDRSFAYEFARWPFPVATSNEELVEEIEQFDDSEYKANVEAHLTDAEAYDNGTASEQVAELIAKYCLK
ncbi:MAG: CDP-glycerol glycerophosphotransferase family protein [Ruminiclostridium sp.]|nr:CDP-glycerol glycerophosphotransferase family protein [Ruminiclostridium sp.]